MPRAWISGGKDVPSLAAKGDPPQTVWQLCHLCWPAPGNVLLQLGDLASQKCLQILECRPWQYRHTGWSQSTLLLPSWLAERKNSGTGREDSKFKTSATYTCCSRQCRCSWDKHHGVVDFGSDTANIKSKEQSLKLLILCHTLSVWSVPHYLLSAY